MKKVLLGNFILLSLALLSRFIYIGTVDTAQESYFEMSDVCIEQSQKTINDIGIVHEFIISNSSEYDLKSLAFTLAYKFDENELASIVPLNAVETVKSGEYIQIELQVPKAYYHEYIGDNLVDDSNIVISLDGYYGRVSSSTHLGISGGLLVIEEDNGVPSIESHAETIREN